jgi:hypothetical protein
MLYRGILANYSNLQSPQKWLILPARKKIAGSESDDAFLADLAKKKN